MTADGIHSSRAVAADPHVQLRKMAHAMEGLFLNQLFQAMRASVPASGGEDAPAQQMFTSLFDQQVAASSAQQQSRGLGEALYHQLARRLDAAGPASEQKGL